MTPRAPYSMVQLISEINALDTGATDYENLDGLGIYQTLRVTSPDHDRMLTALRHVRRYDTRLTEVTADGDDILVRFTAAGGRWTRDPFHFADMWDAVEEKKRPVKKAAKRPVKKS